MGCKLCFLLDSYFTCSKQTVRYSIFVTPWHTSALDTASDKLYDCFSLRTFSGGMMDGWDGVGVGEKQGVCSQLFWGTEARSGGTFLVKMYFVAKETV